MMIAEVYPLKRMPRSMPLLDYQVPENLLVDRGSLVQIPFRTQKIIGIVRKIKDQPLRGVRLKKIFCVIERTALSEKEISFFEYLAAEIAQPVSNVLYAQFPSPADQVHIPVPSPCLKTTLTIPSSEAATVSRLATELKKRCKAFVQVSDLRRTAAVLAKYLSLSPSAKMVIVCPHVQDVRVMSRALSTADPLTVTGEESKNRQNEIRQCFRQSRNAILITTRVGMLFADQQVTAIFVVRSGHHDHVLHDRNPRLDTRIVMADFADQMSTNIFFLDVYPRPEDLYFFGQENMLSFPITTTPIFIDSRRERLASKHAVLTASCLTAIESALKRQQRVLLIYNKKKQTQTYGMKPVADALRKFFPDTPCQIVDVDHLSALQSQLILVTQVFVERLFDPTQKNSVGCVIHLDPDTAFFSTDLHASWRALWSLAQWRGVAHALRAQFLVQTSEREWFEERLDHPEKTLKDELAYRGEYHQPPFFRWALVLIKEQEPRKRQWEEQLFKQRLEQMKDVEVKVLDSQKKNESVIQIRFLPKSSKDILILFSGLDDRYIIDMNAYAV